MIHPCSDTILSLKILKTPVIIFQTSTLYSNAWSLTDERHKMGPQLQGISASLRGKQRASRGKFPRGHNFKLKGRAWKLFEFAETSFEWAIHIVRTHRWLEGRFSEIAYVCVQGEGGSCQQVRAQYDCCDAPNQTKNTIDFS